MEYRDGLLAPFLPPPALGEGHLLARIGQSDRVNSYRKTFSVFSRIRFLREVTMNPIVATCLIIAVAGVALFLTWQRHAPTVSASELLGRAKSWDTASTVEAQPGVIYQQLGIRLRGRNFQRTSYRDRQGLRRPKTEPVSTDLAPLKAMLDTAGVDWTEPLSASSYEAWHDRQHPNSDEVRHTGPNNLTLTTKTSGGLVVQESLTVRENDFHPIKRTVELLDIGIVEIAEINYAVLDWDVVNEALFEAPETALVSTSSVTPRPATPAVPSAPELDEAELRARLMLNLHQVDTGEQIRIVRTNTGVEVKGVVATDERKTELSGYLERLAHVTSAILSIEELSAHAAGQPGAISLEPQSVVGQASPLGQYMKERNSSPDELSRVSQQLLDAALQIQRNTAALSELLQRFPSAKNLSDSARAVRNQLLLDYLQGINSGSDNEQTSLAAIGLPPESQPEAAPSVSGTIEDLAMEVDRNNALCRELIVGSPESQSPARALATSLSESLARIRSAGLRLQSPE